MNQDAKKTARQQAALGKWVAAGCRASFEWVTGSGKTRLALMAIRQMNSRHPERTTIIGVPGIDLKAQWEEQVAEWKLKHVQVLVSNTLINRLEQPELFALKCDLLVLDELHNWAAFNASKVFSLLKYRFILGLTATLEREDQRHHIITRYAPVCDSLDIVEGLREGYVSPFRVFNLGIELSAKERLTYDAMNREFHKWFAVFHHDLKLAMSCLNDERAVQRHADKLQRELQEIKTAAFQFNRNMAKRKAFLYGLESKQRITKELIEAFEVPTITFSQTTDVPVRLAAMMPEISVDYGSHLSAKMRKLNLQRFNTEPGIRVIHTARALDEGKDVAGLELAIVLASTSSVRATIQRDGRVLRVMPDKQAIIINLYARDTQDEKWLRSRQEKTINITWVNSVQALLLQTGKAVTPDEERQELVLR